MTMLPFVDEFVADARAAFDATMEADRRRIAVVLAPHMSSGQGPAALRLALAHKHLEDANVDVDRYLRQLATSIEDRIADANAAVIRELSAAFDRKFQDLLNPKGGPDGERRAADPAAEGAPVHELRANAPR